jgi:hypothetical protein
MRRDPGFVLAIDADRRRVSREYRDSGFRDGRYCRRLSSAMATHRNSGVQGAHVRFRQRGSVIQCSSRVSSNVEAIVLEKSGGLIHGSGTNTGCYDGRSHPNRWRTPRHRDISSSSEPAA